MKFISITRILFVLSFSLSLVNCGKSQKNEDPNPDVRVTPDPPVEIASDIGSSQIPYVVVNTSEDIRNEPKIPATFHVQQNGEWIHNEFIGIEYRGSTSFRLTDKKSFGIETWDQNGRDINVSLFGLPKEEDWILNGHIVGLDKTLMHHHLAYKIFAEMGNYSSRTQFVELELDGDYRGVYVFMEKLKRDNDRIDIAKLEASDADITGGYIIKIDKAAGGDLGLEDMPLEYFENNWNDDATYRENFSFRSNYDINGELIDFPPYSDPYETTYLETYFIYDYPKKEDITAAQKTYIQTYLDDFETALLTDDFSTAQRTYTNYIDLDSFVDMFIINELCRNVDGYRLSTFLHKDKGEKLRIGPPWDFNIGFAEGGRIPMDRWVIDYNDVVGQDAWMMPFWWQRFMEDDIFKSSVKARWQVLRAGPLSTANIHGIIDLNADYLVDNGAISRNDAKWGDHDFAGAVDALKTFITDRSNLMDAEIGAF